MRNPCCKNIENTCGYNVQNALTKEGIHLTAKELVSQMTLEEKASLCSGRDFWHTKPIERLGLEAVMVTDGPHGLRKQEASADHVGINDSVPATCFPLACATACSFDRAMLREMGAAMGEEALAEEVAVILGPGANLKRSPLCGRNFEYFSEDPCLSGEMAAALIAGIEAQGVGTSLKHYAANNQEARRMSINVVADERALRELYLSGFETAVKKGKPATLMCSYNLVNGTYASDNKWLLTDVLRDEWGFDGLVMTDWGAMNDRVKAVVAGLDLEMPGGSPYNDEKIVAAVNAGTLSMEDLDKVAVRVVELVQRGMAAKAAKKPYDKAAHHAATRKAAANSCVLLQNEGGLLPLKPGADIAVIGKFAKEPRYQGAGSSKINPTRLDNAHDELAALGFKVTYADGYKGVYTNEPLVAEACGVAKGKDAVVIFAGLPAEFESEGFDRTTLSMPDSHLYLIEKVAAENPNTVVVLQLGAPVLTPFVGKVKSLVVSYLGGQAGGGGIADVLAGVVNPGGKLAESWPQALADTACFNYFPGATKSVEYRESIFTGYRYYEAAGRDVAWPFGFGLSYTQFAYSGLAVSKPAFDGVDDLTVYCTVKNTGEVAGAEVVQLYVGKEQPGKIMRAKKELRDFDKVWLEPGESKVVSFKLDKRSFAYYNPAANAWCVEGGAYTVSAAASSADVRLCTTVQVAGDGKEELLAAQQTDCPEYFGLANATGGVNGGLVVSDASFEKLYGQPLPAPARDPNAPFDENSTLDDMKNTFAGKMLKRIVAKQGAKLMPQEGPADDIRIMLEAMMMEMPLRGMAMMSGGALTPHRMAGILDMANGKFFGGVAKLAKKEKR